MVGSEVFSRRGASQELFIEDCSLNELATRYGTPLYVYSKRYIMDAFQRYSVALKHAFPGAQSPLICVSVKANGNLSLLNLLASVGAGFDVVSGGELLRVVASGGVAGKVVFAGVGKTDSEIRLGLEHGILLFNVESRPELERINTIAGELGVKAPVAIRVNPNVDAKTHAYISTGMSEHKFGMPFEDARQIYATSAEFPNIELCGVDCHIGSMITDLTAFRDAYQKVRELVLELRGAGLKLKYVDVGGGLGVQYKSDDESQPEMSDYVAILKAAFQDLELTLIVEPGRSIFANSGVLLSSVVFVKQTEKKRFVILDAGFSELIRPVLYDAYHEIQPVSIQGAKVSEADIVGPICESTDCFAHARPFPEVSRGDVIAIMSAGAYGFQMSSNYNTRPRPPEILVCGASSVIIRNRETVQELLANELQCLA